MMGSMGAWGSAAFDNDDALDWWNELLAGAGGAELLREPLAALANAGDDDFPEVDDASPAIAAAEVVAAVGGAPGRRLPLDVRRWAARAARLPDDLPALALRAVGRVIEDSELADLWDGDEAWLEAMNDLASRLAALTTPRTTP